MLPGGRRCLKFASDSAGLPVPGPWACDRPRQLPEPCLHLRGDRCVVTGKQLDPWWIGFVKRRNRNRPSVRALGHCRRWHGLSQNCYGVKKIRISPELWCLVRGSRAHRGRQLHQNRDQYLAGCLFGAGQANRVPEQVAGVEDSLGPAWCSATRSHIQCSGRLCPGVLRCPVAVELRPGREREGSAAKSSGDLVV